MADEPSTMRPISSSNTSAHSKPISAISVLRAKVLFQSYRRGDANDPEGYVAAIAAVLSLYDADLQCEVTDPRSGIQTTEKFATFLPNAGELKRYCESIVTHRENLKRLGPPIRRMVPLPPPRQPGDKATIHVPHTHPRYASLIEWSLTANDRLFKLGNNSEGIPGIWIDWGTWERQPRT